MLAESCPSCGLPLFRREDETFCTSCGKVQREVASEEREETKAETDSEKEKHPVLEKKREELLKRLEEESDMRVVNEILAALKKINELH